MNVLFRLLRLLWIGIFAVLVRAETTQTTLTIYYTASLNGNLDGCNCVPCSGLRWI